MKRLNIDIGDRMKLYEQKSCSDFLIPRIPVITRLDGISFHSFTKGLNRPFDGGLSNLMIETTKYLVDKTNALIGYTQSDEITLIYLYDSVEQTPFRGKIFKICSSYASKASSFFNMNMQKYLPSKNKLAEFDCRVFNVPTKDEAVNNIQWRENDATKNSISMAASCVYSHKQLMYKNGGQMQEMLFQKGINWNNYPDFFKRGSYIQKKSVELKYTSEQLLKMKNKPETDFYIRNEIKILDLPPIFKIINKIEMVFEKEEYKLQENN